MYPSRRRASTESDDDSIYVEECRTKGVDEDIWTGEDDGFMKGYVESMEPQEEDELAWLDEDASAEEVV